jgi:acetate kinase
VARGVTILALNGGSSSLKYALFEDDQLIARGAVDRIGTDHAAAVGAVFDKIDRPPHAVGHRLVHGGPDHTEPALVDPPLIKTLERAIAFAPLHLPAELATIAAVRERFGELPQVVCFDTGFHRTLPEVARRFALPAALYDAGIRRYGFHGLSYEYVAASVPAKARAVFAHLGNGASMVAVHNGRSIDTTMGLTPTGGLVMGTRSGDLDPGLLIYLLDHGYDARGLARLVEHEAGLLALSGTTSDMQRLLGSTDPRAALAIDVFCYQARRAIGSLAAALEGLDQLVFTGGIGEHAPPIRWEICRGLAHLGIALDEGRNLAGAPIISTGACEVRVVATDEERVIARHTRRLLAEPPAPLGLRAVAEPEL